MGILAGTVGAVVVLLLGYWLIVKFFIEKAKERGPRHRGHTQ